MCILPLPVGLKIASLQASMDLSSIEKSISSQTKPRIKDKECFINPKSCFYYKFYFNNDFKIGNKIYVYLHSFESLGLM